MAEQEIEMNHPTLETFLAETKPRLREILKRLDWDLEKTITFNHTEARDHQNNEAMRRDTEPELPPSCAVGNSISMDVEELRKIVADTDKEIPNKFSELQMNFTREQKIAIYEHVVANTVKYTEPEITVPALGENALTFAQIVAQKKRESKKRRRHRQSKPTHTEEVRAIVDLHMQALQQYLNTKVGEKHKSEPTICKRERYGTDRKHLDEKYYRRRSPHPERNLNSHRGRSKSYERKISKNHRHRSRSTSKSYKHKDRGHDRSRSKERKTHKYRSRSRSRNISKSYSRSRQSGSSNHNDSRRSKSSNRHRNRRSRSRSRSYSRRKKEAHHLKSKTQERSKIRN